MRYRVYFNRKREAPQVWSVDEGSPDSEINVVGFTVHGCEVISVWTGLPANEDMPVAWIEFDAASMEVVNGCAHFFKWHLGD